MKRLAVSVVAATCVALAAPVDSRLLPSAATTRSTFAIATQGATIALPAPRGFRAALTYPSNDSAPGMTATIRISRTPPISLSSVPAVTGLLESLPGSAAPLAWIEVTTSSTVHFVPGIVEFRLFVPNVNHFEDLKYACVACDELACRVVHVDLPSDDDGIVAGNRFLPIRFRFTAFGEHPYIAAIFSHSPAPQ